MLSRTTSSSCLLTLQGLELFAVAGQCLLGIVDLGGEPLFLVSQFAGVDAGSLGTAVFEARRQHANGPDGTWSVPLPGSRLQPSAEAP